ncbi:MAG TPA: LacI family DNA-binding transcriptional regulator [Gemmatimonadaceae bacterium]
MGKRDVVLATTAEEIAKLAGCSASTVSRVLNNSAPVSRQVREAVFNAIRERGAVPRSRIRRRAADRDPRTPRQAELVEVVMHLTAPIEHMEVVNGQVRLGPIAPCPPDRFFRPDNRYSNSHFRRIIDGVLDEVARWEMRGVVRTVDSLEGNRLLNDVNSPGVSGLILLGNEGPAVEAFLRRCRCPIVSFVGLDRDDWPPSVGCDDVPGIREAVRHLADLGHTRIGYIAGLEGSPAFERRCTAFKLAMIDADLPLRPQWVFSGSRHVADIIAAARLILAQPDRPTAMICCYDAAAVGVMLAAEKSGLSVPKDLSVIGFGNQEISELVQPTLTTVNVPTYEMGRAAVKLLRLQQLQPASAEGLSVRLRTSLVVRGSTAAPPHDV